MKEEKLTIITNVYQESVSNMLPYGKIKLEDVIKTFKEKYDFVKNLYPQYDWLTLEFEYEYSYYDSCSFEAKFYGNRLETDEEYEKRMKAKEVRAEASKKALITAHKNKEIEERTLYETLKKKFGI